MFLDFGFSRLNFTYVPSFGVRRLFITLITLVVHLRMHAGMDAQAWMRLGLEARRRRGFLNIYLHVNHADQNPTMARGLQSFHEVTMHDACSGFVFFKG